MMSEDELQKRRQEYRDQEIQSKISSYGQVQAMDFRQQTLKSNYTRKTVDKNLGKIGWGIILTQAVSMVFFCALFVMSYIPKTKFLVSSIMP